MTTSATERVRGFTYGAGASAETVGAEHLCMNVLPVPVGGRAKAHYHRGSKISSYLLNGECAVAGGEPRANPTCATRRSFLRFCGRRRESDQLVRRLAGPI